AEAVSTACYVLNRVLVTKPQKKTPYELLTGKIPIISYIRPFGCHVTISNTIDHQGKFAKKSDEGFLVGYSISSKAFRPITPENKANHTAGPKEANNSSSYTSTVKSLKAKNGDKKLNEDTDSKKNEESVDQEDQTFLEELKRLKRQEKKANDVAETLRKTNSYGNSRFRKFGFWLTCLLGRRQKEGINYDEVFALVARIEAIKIFLAFASYMGFIVYQMDVKSAFSYGKINEEVYVSQPSGFIDPKFPNKVYKVVKPLYGLHQALRACVKTAGTPIKTKNPLVKDEEAADVDVHLYRSMIGSLMYLTAFRLDIMGGKIAGGLIVQFVYAF
nr:retrovirus-related Pol polyprotein from transposon TNT 1-94 [Tanacetum cinerariifolium]